MSEVQTTERMVKREALGTSKQSNPPWSRDELILALDLYLRYRDSLPNKNTEVVRELSGFLGRLGKALRVTDSVSFRNENGVYMKLGNFRRWDPDYVQRGRLGLVKGNKDEGFVWAEFANDPERLSSVVAAIRGTVDAAEPTNLSVNDEDELGIQEAEEGRVLTRLHRLRERSRALVQAKKKEVLKKTGRLRCEACGFDFAETYGAIGEGIIDVHHTKPLHTLRPGDRTKLNELALLCANCHRIVHSTRRWLSVTQVKSLIAG